MSAAAYVSAAFLPGKSRPSPWKPGQYQQYAALRDAAVAAESRAVNLWGWYWWKDRWNDPAGEAVLFQAVDILMRVSGLLMLDAAREAVAT